MAYEHHASQRFNTLPAVLDPANGVPLYVQLADIFRYQVLSGAWPVGYQLENSERLGEHYSVARITVRQAIARLVQEGMLHAQRGKGTTVIAYAKQEPGIADQLSFRYIYNGTANALPPEFRGDFLAFERYVELTKINEVNDQAVAMIRIFVAESVHKVLPRRAMDKEKVLDLVLEHAPKLAKHMRHRITVEPADIVVAQHLHCTVGAPVAKIIRQVYGADRRLSYAGISWHRGDTFEMDMTLPSALIKQTSPAIVAPGVRRA
jgi:GntR family transcriptional regulator